MPTDTANLYLLCPSSPRIRQVASGHDKPAFLSDSSVAPAHWGPTIARASSSVSSSRLVAWLATTRLQIGSTMKRQSFAASPAQRLKVRGETCIACGVGNHCDPAHVVSRALGGCDDPLCVVALCRPCHRAYDLNELDLEPLLVGRYIPELQHALGHTRGSLSRLQRILNGAKSHHLQEEHV